MINFKDITIRALKTFVQAFVPVIIVAVGSIDITDISASKAVLYSALISASSAGLSAVWNMISQLIKNSTVIPEGEEPSEFIEVEDVTEIEIQEDFS